MKILWSPTALTRLSDIVEYIAYDNPTQAEKWADKILDTVKRLEDFPKIGRIVPEIEIENIREIISGNYRIIYEITKTHIMVLTIRHCRRLLDKDEIIKK